MRRACRQLDKMEGKTREKGKGKREKKIEFRIQKTEEQKTVGQRLCPLPIALRRQKTEEGMRKAGKQEKTKQKTRKAESQKYKERMRKAGTQERTQSKIQNRKSKIPSL